MEEVDEEVEVDLPSCICLHTVVGIQKETDSILKWRCALPHYIPPFITCCASAPQRLDQHRRGDDRDHTYAVGFKTERKKKLECVCVRETERETESKEEIIIRGGKEAQRKIK